MPKFQYFFLDSGESFLENNLNNMLLIGTGKGKLDEHRNLRWSDRIPGECAATLVAKDIKEKLKRAGFDPQELFSPIIEKLLDRFLEYDTKGERVKIYVCKCYKGVSILHKTYHYGIIYKNI